MTSPVVLKVLFRAYHGLNLNMIIPARFGVLLFTIRRVLLFRKLRLVMIFRAGKLSAKRFLMATLYGLLVRLGRMMISLKVGIRILVSVARLRRSPFMICVSARLVTFVLVNNHLRMFTVI